MVGVDGQRSETLRRLAQTGEGLAETMRIVVRRFLY